mmetsp:Transcript_18590/g.54439  ORF Transcript_18590/g.54439 Transcript_18590/m.54439 type:complete len:220 (+) Transcript_18590:432-1091(+)
MSAISCAGSSMPAVERAWRNCLRVTWSAVVAFILLLAKSVKKGLRSTRRVTKRWRMRAMMSASLASFSSERVGRLRSTTIGGGTMSGFCSRPVITGSTAAVNSRQFTSTAPGLSVCLRKRWTSMANSFSVRARLAVSKARATHDRNASMVTAPELRWSWSRKVSSTRRRRFWHLRRMRAMSSSTSAAGFSSSRGWSCVRGGRPGWYECCAAGSRTRGWW